MNEIDPTVHSDAAVSRATWMIGVAAALTFGMAIGVAVTDTGGSGAARPQPDGAASSAEVVGAAWDCGPRP